MRSRPFLYRSKRGSCNKRSLVLMSHDNAVQSLLIEIIQTAVEKCAKVLDDTSMSHVLITISPPGWISCPGPEWGRSPRHWRTGQCRHSCCCCCCGPDRRRRWAVVVETRQPAASHSWSPSWGRCGPWWLLRCHARMSVMSARQQNRSLGYSSWASSHHCR